MTQSSKNVTIRILEKESKSMQVHGLTFLSRQQSKFYAVIVYSSPSLYGNFHVYYPEGNNTP